MTSFFPFKARKTIPTPIIEIKIPINKTCFTPTASNRTPPTRLAKIPLAV